VSTKNTGTGLTKERCTKLRKHLRDLGYGQAEGETDELFGRRFYPVSEHLRALDAGVILIVGPRGVGKSELFKTFFSDDQILRDSVRSRAPRRAGVAVPSSRTTWNPVYPAGLDFPDTRALARHVRTDEDAKNLWYAMVVRSLSGELESDARQALRSLLDPMGVELGKILKAVASLDEKPTAALDALERSLRNEDRWIFVGYDELDTLGGSDWELRNRLIRGLMSFWSDYSRRWRRIRAKIFLRSDLFRRHAGLGSADFAKLAANRAELAWPDKEILGMLVKRIANTSSDLADYCRKSRIEFKADETLGLVPVIQKAPDVYPLLERMAGEHMGAQKKKGYVRNWLLDHLRDGNGQIVPRTMVRLIEQAATKDAANESLRPPRLLHPTALRQALDDVSNDHVTQGITSEWPWLAGVKQRLSTKRLVPWKRVEIVGLLQVDWEKSWSQDGQPVRPPEERPEDLVEYLVELGIFRRRPDERIDVPDLYLSGFGLRRKGGVRAGKRTHRSKRS
jgi:hypothetical protein